MPLYNVGLPSPLQSVHIMGICGTAMGALAAMLKDDGYQVTGSDSSIYPPMSDVLAGLGIPVMEGFRARNLEHRPDLVVVGNVVRAVYEEASALLESDLAFCSFPHLLGSMFLRGTRSLVVAGTHGKTTATALAAHVLIQAGRAPGYLVGGVVKGFPRSAVACHAPTGTPRHFVIEGDEYDTAFFDKRPKFVHYRPRTAVLTGVEFDHADIYKDLGQVQRAFLGFTRLLPPEDGCLVVAWNDDGARQAAAGARCEIRRYGSGCAWDGRILGVDHARGRMHFQVLKEGRLLGEFNSTMVGEHNLWNQVAVAAALDREGLEPHHLARGFETFQGIRRRQEIRAEIAGITVVDDFAHHPTAVRATLEALKLRFGGRRLWAIFEPRSNTSRLNIFQRDYARAFDAADQVVIAPPGRSDKLPPENLLDPRQLVHDLLARGLEAHYFNSIEEIAATVVANTMPEDVLVLLSNGSFGGIVVRVIDGLRARFE